MSRALLALVSAEALLAAALAVHSACPAPEGSAAEASRRANRELVSVLGLTDLAVWPGASHTRHPSQADRFAPFSDHPAAFDRWPGGSVVPPPRPPATGPRPPGGGG